MTDKAIELLQDDLVNTQVETKMLAEQVELVAVAEDIVENLLDPGDTRLAELEDDNAELRRQLAYANGQIKMLADTLEGSRKLYDNRVEDAKEAHQYRLKLEAENARLKAALEAVETSLNSGIQNAKDTVLHSDSDTIYLQANARERALKPVLEALQTALQAAPKPEDNSVHLPVHYPQPLFSPTLYTYESEEDIQPVSIEETAAIEAEFQAHLAEAPLTEIEIRYLAQYEHHADELMAWAVRQFPNNQRESAVEYYQGLLIRKDLPTNRALIDERRKHMKI